MLLDEGALIGQNGGQIGNTSMWYQTWFPALMGMPEMVEVFKTQLMLPPISSFSMLEPFDRRQLATWPHPLLLHRSRW